MRKVIFVDSAKKAEKSIDSVSETKFIILNEVPEANLIRETLKKKNQCQQLNKRVICERNYPNLRDEYVRTSRFLDKAELNKDYIIKIRPHPAIDFNKALNTYRPNKLEFQLDNDKNL